jgi:hypothetical protein
MKGDEDLIHSTVRYAKHITQKSVEGNWETEFEVFQHSLECSLCFTFNINAGGLIPIENFWKSSEEHKDNQHPWANNWSMIKN